MTTANIDPNEVNKFDQRANEWWDPQGEFKPLHDINPLRVKFITDQITLANKKVIDVGCGGGILSESLAKAGANVTGIDLAEQGLQAARAHAEKENISIHYVKQEVEKCAEQHPAQFDVVVCMEMLEHVPSPQSVVQACAALCKPGGKVFFSTINRNLKSYLQAIIAAEYVLRLMSTGTHDYAKFIKPSELENWSRSANLEWQKMIGITYNPISKAYRTTESVDVNYLVCAEKSK